jgi:hypothetical protein
MKIQYMNESKCKTDKYTKNTTQCRVRNPIIKKMMCWTPRALKKNQRQVWISLNSSLQERQVSQTANMLTYTSTDNLRYNKQIASKSPSNPYSPTNFLQYWTTNKSHLMACGFEMAPTRKFDPSMTSN